MKKILTLLFVLIALIASAQNTQYEFRAQALAIKIQENNQWGEWSDWKETSPVKVLIDFYEDGTGLVRVYSKRFQRYTLLELEDAEEGLKSSYAIYYSKDLDKTGCYIRILVGTVDKYTQLYIMYSNVQFVYSLVIVEENQQG